MGVGCKLEPGTSPFARAGAQAAAAGGRTCTPAAGLYFVLWPTTGMGAEVATRSKGPRVSRDDGPLLRGHQVLFGGGRSLALENTLPAK